MSFSIDESISILQNYLRARQSGSIAAVDRKEVVAHATVSAFVAHWPTQAGDSLPVLLAATSDVPEQEKSRWMVQRRIAISRLSKNLCV